MAYRVPCKAILTTAQLSAFQSSPTHASIIKFIQNLNESVVGAKLGDANQPSSAISVILSILDEIEIAAKEIPPIDNQASRFGNPAFRMFYDRVAEVCSLIRPPYSSSDLILEAS